MRFIEWFDTNLTWFSNSFADCNDPKAIQEVLFMLKQGFQQEMDQQAATTQKVDEVRRKMLALPTKEST